MDLIGNRRFSDSRKSGRRFRKQIACEIEFENHSLGGVTIDLGAHGACIEASLNVHRIVGQTEIRIILANSISRKARIVWSSGARIGLNFTVPFVGRSWKRFSVLNSGAQIIDRSPRFSLLDRNDSQTAWASKLTAGILTWSGVPTSHPQILRTPFSAQKVSAR